MESKKFEELALSAKTHISNVTSTRECLKAAPTDRSENRKKRYKKVPHDRLHPVNRRVDISEVFYKSMTSCLLGDCAQVISDLLAPS